MTDSLSCSRSCEWPAKPDQPAHPKLATHGTLCDACYLRIRLALQAIPDLLQNMRAAVIPGGNFELTERVQSSGDGPPVPFQVSAMDASDALYSKVSTWIDAFAEEFKVQRPSIRAWAVNNEIQGLPAVSPTHAHDLGKQVIHWLLARDEKIAASPSAAAFHDDIVDGWDEQPGVHKLMSRWSTDGPESRPARKRVCPQCGEREVYVAHPSLLNNDPMVLCAVCPWVDELGKFPEARDMFAEEGRAA